MKPEKPASETLAPSSPQSWAVSEWTQRASGDYPHDTDRARYLVRTHKTELLAAGALVRVGRELVVIGPAYRRWLQKKATRVPDFQIAANRTRGARSQASAAAA